MKSIRIALTALLVVQTLTAAERRSLPDLDARTGPGRPVAQADAAAVAARASAENRLKARLPKVAVERDAITGSARWMAAHDGFLTGPNGQGRGMAGAVVAPGLAANDPHGVVKAFVREHAAVVGHDDSALEKARVKRDSTAAHNGVRSTTWEQHIAEVPVYRGSFTAHVSRNGELVTVGSGFIARPENAASPAQQQAVTAGVIPVTAQSALSIAARNLELAEAAWQPASPPEGIEQIQKFSAAGWRTPSRVALMWDPLESTCRHASLSIL